jgi:hypothetical protein
MRALLPSAPATDAYHDSHPHSEKKMGSVGSTVALSRPSRMAAYMAYAVWWSVLASHESSFT